MSELVPYENIRELIIVETADLVDGLLREIIPTKLRTEDIREIINQISDVMTGYQPTFSQELMRLPEFHRMVSSNLFASVEQQHLLKSAVHRFGMGLYERLAQAGAFKSLQYKEDFPYIFVGMLGKDTQYRYYQY